MDLVVRNARIWTADLARPWATALAVSDGRIFAVGEDHDVDAPPGVTTIDAGGQFLMPGIVDSHNHIRLGSGDGAVQLGGATTLAEVHARIGAWLDENPDAPWVMGEGFDYAVVPGGGHPRAEHLDGATGGRPAMLLDYSVHAAWFNREALDRLGVGRGTTRVPYGTFETDDVTGEPTGYLQDYATYGLSRAGLAALQELVPAFGVDAQYDRVRSGLRMAARFGITTVVEPQNSLDDLALFQRARAGGRAPLARGGRPVPPGRDDRRRARRVRRGGALVLRRPVPGRSAQALHRRHRRAAHGRDDRALRQPSRHPRAHLLRADRVRRAGREARRPRVPVLRARDRRPRQPGRCSTRSSTPGASTARATAATRSSTSSASTRPTCRASPSSASSPACSRGTARPRSWASGARTSARSAGATPGRCAASSTPVPQVAFSSDWNVAEMDPLVGVYTALTRASLDGSGVLGAGGADRPRRRAALLHRGRRLGELLRPRPRDPLPGSPRGLRHAVARPVRGGAGRAARDDRDDDGRRRRGRARRLSTGRGEVSRRASRARWP